MNAKKNVSFYTLSDFIILFVIITIISTILMCLFLTMSTKSIPGKEGFVITDRYFIVNKKIWFSDYKTIPRHTQIIIDNEIVYPSHETSSFVKYNLNITKVPINWILQSTEK